MGQQQIVFVLIIVCVLAVVASVGLIVLHGETVAENRARIEQDLHTMARRAQELVRSPVEGGGGEGSFTVLTHQPGLAGRLGVPRSSRHGDFFVKRSKNRSSMQIIGIGVVPGLDSDRPVRMMITVWADSSSLVTLN